MATTITCDVCGSDKDVRAPWITIWNGNSLDLCGPCAHSSGLVDMVDRLGLKAANRLQDD